MVMESKRLYTFPPSRNGLVSTRSFHLKRESTVQRTVLWEQQRNGEEILKISVLSTNSSNDIQQSKLSGILEFLKGFSRLNTMKPSSTWLSNKNHGTLFQNPNNRVSPGKEFHISKLELVKLSHPQSYQRFTHDAAGLRSLPTILWLRWSTHWPISFESWVVLIGNQDFLQPEVVNHQPFDFVDFRTPLSQPNKKNI